jgi:hypothetical protein
MSPFKRIRAPWLIGGSVLTVAVLGFGTLQGVGGLAHQTEHTHTVISAPVRSVMVSGDSRVRILGTDEAAITIDATISKGLASPAHSEAVDGDRLVVSASCPAFLNTWCGVSYTLRIPKGLPVVVHSNGDGISVTGVDGDLDLSSSGGGITVNGGAGGERLNSSGGSINAKGIAAPVVNATSSGGGVHLSFTTSPNDVTAGSSGGGIRIDLPDTAVAYRVEASSSGGSTHTAIRIDPASARIIKAHSSGGGVTVSYTSP